MIYQKLSSFGVLFAILVIAVTSGIFAEEFSFAAKPIITDMSEDGFIYPQSGHVEDISFVKVVSPTGTIAINKINFTVVSDDPNVHLFQICVTIESSKIRNPSIDDTPTCTVAELLPGEKHATQSIDFLNSVNVSDLNGISVRIEDI